MPEPAPLPRVPKERHEWRCNEKGCNVKGKAATKRDAQLALAMHKALVHTEEE